MAFSKEALKAANALKSIARNEQIKAYIQQSGDLYPLLLRAAKRFVAGETRNEGIGKAKELISKGYGVSLEYIGENTRNIEDCTEAKNEFMTLINDLGKQQKEETISLDLSHIGLSIDTDLALNHLQQLANEAQKYGHTVMISMEESMKTDQILDLYKKTTLAYPNVGLTIQAHLYRSEEDIRELLNYPGKIRLVKGAYQESSEISIPRSKALNERYLNLINTIADANHPLSVATHDKGLIEDLVQRELFNRTHVEYEMLYGIRPDLLRMLKEQGAHARVYLTYGSEWYLYLCHRLAEYPPNVYTMFADMVNPSESESNIY